MIKKLAIFCIFFITIPLLGAAQSATLPKTLRNSNDSCIRYEIIKNEEMISTVIFYIKTNEYFAFLTMLDPMKIADSEDLNQSEIKERYELYESYWKEQQAKLNDEKKS